MEQPQRDLERAKGLIQSWRQQGETVVFTNGCFDVLHVGHLWLFENARQLGQRLVIAINSDDYCRRIKGQGRPVQPDHLRRQIVQAVTLSDMVLPLEDDVPERLLQTLRPDIYVLGSDYRGRSTPGAEYCGKTVFVDRLPGISTTQILKRLESADCGAVAGS